MATASPLVVRVRNFFLGRNLQLMQNNRMPENISARTVPAPYLPDGPSHKLNKNPYCLRDGRRLSQPPTLLFSTTKQLAEPQDAEGEKTAATTGVKKPPILGVAREWKLSEDEPYMQS